MVLVVALGLLVAAAEFWRRGKPRWALVNGLLALVLLLVVIF